MLAQYEILERRFLFKRSVFPSKWGRGIGERFSLAGDYSGYPVSLYDHYVKNESGKIVWTSLSLEMLFAGELEIILEPIDGEVSARFDWKEGLIAMESDLERFRLWSNVEEMGALLVDDLLRERLGDFSGKGSFRLSKGFFEYRESGRMLDEAARVRFQNALIILAGLGDRVAELEGPT